MNKRLRRFLEQQQAPVTETAVWGDGTIPLKIQTYITPDMPPTRFITSVRAVLRRDDTVMVVQDRHNSYHIVPGGQCESGESLLETLRREMLEETGWTFLRPQMIAFVHFHHLAPQPRDFPYLYPDFFQVVYTAVADRYIPEAKIEGEYELETRFRLVSEVQQQNLLSDSHTLLLTTAFSYQN